MEKIAASLLATAGIACAQTYNYDSSSETLVITGKGAIRLPTALLWKDQ